MQMNVQVNHTQPVNCIYHSEDLDGQCAAAIVKHYFGKRCRLIGMENRNRDAIPWLSINPHAELIIVDYCLQPFELMLKLADYIGQERVVWIDHHKSAIEAAIKAGFDLTRGIRKIGTAACELAWQYYFWQEPMPQVVRLLGRYDVWDHADPNVLPFQYGARGLNLDPENQFLWDQLFSDGGIVADILQQGSAILRYVAEENRKYCEASAFEMHFDGLRCISINRLLTNSKMFDAVWDPTRHDAMVTFGWRKDRWIVSLYTDKKDIDVSEVAVRHGGGGHAQAAGFPCATLPFSLPKKEG